LKVLITGAAGFGGSGLTKRLLKKGYEVTALDIVAPLHSGLDIDNPKLNYLWKAVHDIQPEDIEGHDIVVHFCAQADVPMGFPSPVWTAWENAMGTVALLEAARKVKIEKLIYAGSGNEWGRPLYLPIDEDHPLMPHNPYSWSKCAQELACWAWYRSYKVPIVVMSNGYICGPGMRREIFVFKWIYNILRNKPIILEGGDQTRDTTYVDDVLDAWELAIQAPKEKVVGEKFQVSYGQELKVRDIAELCMKACGKRVPIIEKPYRPGEFGQRELFSNEKARRVLGYNPKVPPEEAIRLTAEWIKREVLGIT